MPPKFELNQDDFLLGLEWDKRINDLFIEVLADQARMGNFRVGESNSVAIRTGQYIVNKFFAQNFNYKSCLRQAQKLKKRHSVFSSLIRQPGVTYDASTNKMYMNDNVWNVIFRRNSFAGAYRTNGDLNWEDLKVIFGVTLEDRTPPMHPIYGNVITIPSDDEEDYDADDGTTPNGPTEVVDISSTTESSSKQSFWNYCAGGYNSDDASEESFKSPIGKIESSSSTPKKSTYRGKRACIPSFTTSNCITSPLPAVFGMFTMEEMVNDLLVDCSLSL